MSARHSGRWRHKTVSSRTIAALVATDDRNLPRALPATRGECVDAPRPCPYLTCRHHLALDVSLGGGVRLTTTDLETMSPSCALDVSDEGEHTLESIAELLDLTRERIRQIEIAALHKVRAAGGDL